MTGTDESSTGLVPKHHFDVYPAVSPESLAGSMNGRVVLVTGAGRGIGRAIALSFARAGASGLAILSRTRSELESLAMEVASTCPETRTVVCVADITDRAAVAIALKNIEKELGSADVLVANAGVNSFRPFAYTPFEDWWRVVEINLKGPMMLAEMVLPGMRMKNEGAIVFVSSRAGVVSSGESNFNGQFLPRVAQDDCWHLAGASSYYVSKTALVRACICLQIELDTEAGGKSGIHTYVLHPGGVRSEMTLNALHPDIDKMDKGFSQRIRSMWDSPACQDTPELCGQTCVYLASGRASALRGRYVDVEDDIEDLIRQADVVRKENMYDLGVLMLGGERSDKKFSRRR